MKQQTKATIKATKGTPPVGVDLQYCGVQDMQDRHQVARSARQKPYLELDGGAADTICIEN